MRPGPTGAVAKALVLGALATMALAACGSSSSSSSSQAAAVASVRQQDCTLIGGVLANGPDPAADPVGYAQAQVRPLRGLAIAEAPLHRAVLQLAAAYGAYVTATGAAAPAAAVQVSKSEAAVNAICPGVAN